MQTNNPVGSKTNHVWSRNEKCAIRDFEGAPWTRTNPEVKQLPLCGQWQYGQPQWCCHNLSLLSEAPGCVMEAPRMLMRMEDLPTTMADQGQSCDNNWTRCMRSHIDTMKLDPSSLESFSPEDWQWDRGSCLAMSRWWTLRSGKRTTPSSESLGCHHNCTTWPSEMSNLLMVSFASSQFPAKQGFDIVTCLWTWCESAYPIID